MLDERAITHFWRTYSRRAGKDGRSPQSSRLIPSRTSGVRPYAGHIPDSSLPSTRIDPIYPVSARRGTNRTP